MKEFKFVMNEYKNVCYVFVDVNEPPIDTMYLTQYTTPKPFNSYCDIKSSWKPQCHKVKDMVPYRTASIEKMKNFYNKFYDEIYEVFYPKDLLKLPDKITGFYLHSGLNKITKVGQASQDNQFGVVKTHKQAKGIVAYCELSQILPVFNEGWEPDWDRTTIKHCIQTVEGRLVTFTTFECRRLLAFKTEEKAKLFLSEKIDLVNDLQKAMII
jgi:hypothetical protein